MIDKNDEPKKINKSVKFFCSSFICSPVFLFVFIVIYNNMSGYSEIEKTKIELDNNFLYQVIKSQNNWKNLSGEDLIQKQGVDIIVNTMVYFENKILIFVYIVLYNE